jgi:hypothetical protein
MSAKRGEALVVDLIGDPSGRRGDEVRPGGGAVGLDVAGLVLALIETEGRVFVSHQGDIGDDAVEPAVDAKDQIEEALWVLLGE